MAPFAAMVGLYETGALSSDGKVGVPEWILVIGAAGMVLGLATYGYKIMKCLGVKMVCCSCMCFVRHQKHGIGIAGADALLARLLD